MRKRQALMVLGGVAVLLAAGAVVQWLRPAPPGVNRESFQKIRPGMSLAEVEAILGGRPTFTTIAAARERYRQIEERRRKGIGGLGQVYRPCVARWEEDGAEEGGAIVIV